MILGNIAGKTSTREFSFSVRHEVNKFDYVQILHEGNYVLCQILEIEREKQLATAFCSIIGYREKNLLKQLLTPPEPGTEVLKAEDKKKLLVHPYIQLFMQNVLFTYPRNRRLIFFLNKSSYFEKLILLSPILLITNKSMSESSLVWPLA